MQGLETKRQLIHLSGALIALGIYEVGWTIGVAVLAIASICNFTIGRLYKAGIKVPFFGSIIDFAERPGAIQKAPGGGALHFFLGSLITLLVFSFDFGIACASIMVLAVGDSISTLIGTRFGRNQIPYNPEKSIEGTLAGMVGALAGASILVPPHLAALGALGGMFAESLPFKIDDNILVPLGAGAAMSLGLFLF